MRKDLKSPAARLLSQNGDIREHLSGFSERLEQQLMAEEVTNAIDRGEVLICEAGTGTGKTLGYLTPIFLSNKKSIVSTATKALQDQLYYRDIPVLNNTITSPKNVALLKGRQNYLCIYRMGKSFGDPRVDAENQRLLANTSKWAEQTLTGDLDELKILEDGSSIRPFITSTTDNCLGADCPSFSGCHVVKARKEAAAADVVVVNHHLLFADIELKEGGFAELLPDADIVILDEAHKVPDVASLFFSRSISARQISMFCQDCKQAVQKEASDMLTLTSELEKLEQCQRSLRAQIKSKSSRLTWESLKQSNEISEKVGDVGRLLRKIGEQLEIAEERGIELAHCYARVINLKDKWIVFENQATSDHVHWVELASYNFTLFDTPINVAKEFFAVVENSDATWIMTSATLAVKGDFSYFKNYLGLQSAKECFLESPFDYQGQALLYLPGLKIAPSDFDYEKRLIEAALPVLEASEGRAFFLFTSYRSLHIAASIMRTYDHYPLLVQGEAPRNQILKSYQSTPKAVLLGTSSFWEGIDVRGSQLSVVIIDKLPFMPPTDPVIEARITRLTEVGENAFEKIQIPHAVTVLKQGAGRLIRDFKDRGVLMLGDNRIETRAYGETFLESLPPMRITNDIEDVQIFFDPSR
jgi:ATP-dependent DNA helicase DinG